MRAGLAWLGQLRPRTQWLRRPARDFAMPHHGLRFAILIGMLVAVGVGASVYAGYTLVRDARESWRVMAAAEAARLTGVADMQIAQSHTALRAFSALFHGSDQVTPPEFETGVALLDDDESASVFLGFAYAMRVPRRERQAVEQDLALRFQTVGSEPELAPDTYEHWVVTMLGGQLGGARRGTDLATHPEMRAAVAAAYRTPGEIISSVGHVDERGQIQLIVALAAPNADRDGVLLGAFDVAMFIDFEIRVASPEGLDVRLIERSDLFVATGSYARKPLSGGLLPPRGVVETFVHRIAQGQSAWEFHWDLSPSYLGGPPLGLARAAIVGGIAATLLFAALAVLLLRQNIRIANAVAQRTAELARARDQAELASRTKTEFLANVSHELRTPLNAIIGFAEVMGSEMFGSIGDRRYRGYVRDIRDSGIHLLAVINDILDLAKIEAGREELQEEEIDLESLATSCVRIVGERAAENGLTLVVDVPPGMPAIVADGRKLKQILINLMSNAIKFTPNGGRISLTARLDEALDCEIVVRDNGIGMSMEDIPKAMSSFGQVDSTLGRRFDGTGLGLPLTKHLTELHGGQLSIHSAPGSGTAVRIVLPAQRVLARAAE